MNMGIIAASRLRGAVDPMFGNAVAYYRLDETTGDAIDLVNGYNGTLNGSIVRNGEYYTFSENREYINIPDEDDFSFTDGSGNNTDFVIKTEVIFDDIIIEDRAWLVSKRAVLSSDIQEYQFIYRENELDFSIWNSSNTVHSVVTTFIPTTGQKYILGVTLNGTSLSLFINGVIEKTVTLPNYFTFHNGTSPLQIADATFSNYTSLQFLGQMKETVIIKGNGWTQQNITDNYNGGAGITY
jgi:hypothetical protein